MKTRRLTKRIFLFSLVGMLISTNVSIGSSILLEEYKLTTDMLGTGGLWLETGIIRILIFGIIVLASGLRLLDYKYVNRDK